MPAQKSGDPNLESESEDLKYRLNEEHYREHHVEIGQRVAVDPVRIVFTGRVKLNTTRRYELNS